MRVTDTPVNGTAVQQELDTALPAGTDLRAYARLLHRVHAAVLSGDVPRRRAPRPVIADSWDRTQRLGVRTERYFPGHLLPREELERRRGASPLGELLPGSCAPAIRRVRAKLAAEPRSGQRE